MHGYLLESAIRIIVTPIPFSDTIKTLGVTLDQNFSLNEHVSSQSCNICFYTHVLRHIRPALTESMAASLVQSRLDYANSIMYGMSASNMHKLQSSTQNSMRKQTIAFVCYWQTDDIHTFCDLGYLKLLWPLY